MKPCPARAHAAALAGVLACFSLAVFLYHSLAGGTLLAVNYHDSYSLQAENWLAGRNYIAQGENYPWLELAVYQGRYYQSFPPVPSAVLLPWAAAAGSAWAVPANLVIAIFGLCTAAGVYACFWRRGAAPATAAFFAVFVMLGSNTFWLCCSGGVWFMAQVLALCFCVWGIFYAQGTGARSTALASLCFAAAIGCRPFYIVPAVLWGLGRLRSALRCKKPAALLPAVLPAAVVAAAMLAYNAARFGSPLEFGHNYLPEFQRAEHGQFHISYLWPNLCDLLRPVTLDSALQLHFPVFEGFLPLLANPLFLLWLCCGVYCLFRAAPRGAALPLPTAGGVLAVLCIGTALCYCMHRTLGGWQFGARYMVDLLIYPLLWFLGRAEHWQPRAGALTLCGMAVLFNLYGAVYMLGA